MSKPKVVIVAGSRSDHDHVEDLVRGLSQFIEVDVHYGSAHREPRHVLEILDKYKLIKNIIYVTIAGRSNALSGMIAANTEHVVIACPPFKSTMDYMVDIHSTLRMPREVPVLTILGVENCVTAVNRIAKLCQLSLEE